MILKKKSMYRNIYFHIQKYNKIYIKKFHYICNSNKYVKANYTLVNVFFMAFNGNIKNIVNIT